MPLRQSEKKFKIVLDTNNLISAQINKKGASFKIFNLFEQGRLLLYSSPFQIQELERVLGYQRIKKKYRLTGKERARIIKIVKRHIRKVHPQKIPLVIPEDPDDDNILAIALEGKVDFIISGDRHLLKLKNFKNIPIILAKDFLEKKEIKKFF